MERRTFEIAAILLLLAASAQAFASGEAEVDAPRAIWVQPLGAVLMYPLGGLYLPLGGEFPVTENISLAFEASYCAESSAGKPDAIGFQKVMASFGPLFHLASLGKRSHFFVQPKLVGVYSSEGSAGPDPILERRHAGGRGWVVQMAADIGFEKAWGHFFLGTALGAGVGYAFNSSAPLPQGTSPILLWRNDGHRYTGIDIGFNLNLLRVGYAF